MLLLRALLIFSIGIPNFAFAEDKKQNIYFSSWGSSCVSQTISTKKVCGLERHVFFDRAMTRKMLSVGFRTIEAKPVLMTIVSPLGSLISEGVSLEIGAISVKNLPYIFCDQNGCVSQLQLDQVTLNSLIKAKKIILKYQLLNTQKATIDFDIVGFEAEFLKIKQ